MSQSELSPSTTQESTQTTTPTGPTSTGPSGGTSSPLKKSLRGMSYSDGAKALSTRDEGGGDGAPVQLSSKGNPVQRDEAPTTTTETDPTTETNDAATTDRTGPPVVDGNEVADVKATHEQTITKLEDKIRELAGLKGGLFKSKAKKQAGAAKEIFDLLTQYDSATITAAWTTVKAEAADAWGAMINAIGYKDAAQSHPREAHATLDAASDEELVGLANEWQSDNTFAASMALGLTDASKQAEFKAQHPDFGKKLTAKDLEQLDASLFSETDAALRSGEEDYRKRAKAEDKKDADADAKTTELMSEGEGGSADAKALVTNVETLITGGNGRGAIEALCAAADAAIFTAAVRTLDGKGLIRQMFDGIKFEDKWNAVPALMKRVLASRSADKNIADAQSLMGLKHMPAPGVKPEKKDKKQKAEDATITSTEAYGAYQFLKALPATQREQFQKTYPELVSAIEMHMNASMREADDTNLIGAGGGDQADVAALETSIRGSELWFDKEPGQLGMTLKLGIKASLRSAIGDKIEAMKTSGELTRLYQDGARKSIVEGALGTTGPMPTLEGTADPAALAAAWAGTLKTEHKITTENQDLNDYSVLGAVGAVMDANKTHNKKVNEEQKAYEEAKKRGENPPPPTGEKHNIFNQGILNHNEDGLEIEDLALDKMNDAIAANSGIDMELAKGDDKNPERNRADIRFDENNGVVEFKAASLELVRLRYPYGDMLVEIGPAVMKNLEVRATWPTPHNPAQASGVHVSAKSVDLTDLMITGPGMMVGIGKFLANDILFETGEAGVDLSDNPSSEKVLAMVAKQNPARTIVGSYISGDFLSSMPELVAAFAGAPKGALGGTHVSVGGVSVSAVQVGDKYVDKGHVEGLELLMDNRPSVISKARIQQLATMISDAQAELGQIPGDATDDAAVHKRERLDGSITSWSGERDTLTAKLPEWEKLEKLYQELYETQKIHGPQGPDDPAALDAIRARAAEAGIPGAEGMSLSDLARTVHDKLNSGAGAVVSVKSAGVEGVDANGVTVKSAEVSNVNIAGQGDDLGTAMDPRMIKRLGGKEGEDALENGTSTGASVDIGKVKVEGVSIDGGAPKAEALTKTKKTLDDLRTRAGTPVEGAPSKLGKDDQGKLDALEKEWATVLSNGQTFGQVAEAMVTMWVNLGPTKINESAELKAQFHSFEVLLAGHPITIDAIVAEGIHASGTTVSNGQDPKESHATSEFSVGEVTATGIGMGDIHVESVTATDASGSVTVDRTKDADGNTTTDAHGELNVDKVKAQNIDLGNGMTVAEAGVTDVSVSGSINNETSELSLGVGKIYSTGVGLAQGLKVAQDKKKKLTDDIAAKNAAHQPCEDLKAQLQQIEKGLTEYQDAYKTQAAVQVEMDGVDQKIKTVLGQRKLAVDEQAVTKHSETVQGGKDQAKVDADRIKAIDKQLATLQQQKADIAKKFDAPNKIIAAYESTLGINGTASVEDLTLSVSGGPGLDQLNEKDADGNSDPNLGGTYQMELGVGPLLIPQVDYAAPGMGVRLGSAGMPSLKAKAAVTVEKTAAVGDKPSSHSIKQVTIDRLEIPEVTGSQLALTMDAGGETVLIELPSATMKGLSLTGVKLPGLDAEALKTASGEFKLAEVKASMQAHVGTSMSANTSLTLSDLHAEALSSGALNFGLGGLTVDKMGFEQKTVDKAAVDGTLVNQITKLGGKATILGKVTANGSYDRITGELKTTVGLGGMHLSGIHYSAGGTALAVGSADLQGVSATVRAKPKQGDVPEGESSWEVLMLDDLSIDSLKGANIDYTGKGNKRERFGNGTEKVTAFDNHIALKSGSIKKIHVSAMDLNAKTTALNMTVGSANVTGLAAKFTENGKNVLEANASANVQGIAIDLVDDDLTLDIGSASGSADAIVGDGENSVGVSLDDATLSKNPNDPKGSAVHAQVKNMGKDNQAVKATVGQIDAKQLDFAMGVKGSGIGGAHALGTANLQGVTFEQAGNDTHVHVDQGSGVLIGGGQTDGVTTGTYDPKNPDATKQSRDQIQVPKVKVTYDISALEKLNGMTEVRFPDGRPMLHVNIVNGVAKLDFTENIDQIWSSKWKDIKGDGAASLAPWDFEAWSKRLDAITSIPGDALKTGLLKGVEGIFNKWGESITGGWANIAKSLIETLNADPKTSLLEAKPETFLNFQQELDSAINEYVVKNVMDYGMLFDVSQGELGRAASDAGNWIMQLIGDGIDAVGGEGTTDIDDVAEKNIEGNRQAREKQVWGLVKEFELFILGLNMNVDMGSKDGNISSYQAPISDPSKKKKLMSSLVDLHVKGGGSLGGGLALSGNGSLRNFMMDTGSSKIAMDQMDFGVVAGGKVDLEHGADNRSSSLVVGGGGAVGIKFRGLDYKTTAQGEEHNMAQTGSSQPTMGSPTESDGATTYDASDYATRINAGENLPGPRYEAPMTTSESLTNTGIGLVSEKWAESYKNSIIPARTAEVLDKYERQAPK